jgi:hypothetical protein
MKTANLLGQTLLLCGAFLFVSLHQQTARADLIANLSTTTTAYVSPAAGLTQFYTSVAAASATTTQGQPSPTSGTTAYTVLSETFTPTSAVTLGGFNILETGTPGIPIGVHLYDVTASITPGTAGTQGTGATYPAAQTDLFGGGAGLSYNSFNGGTVQGLFQLTNGATNDQVSLIAGETYALEFWTPTSGGTAQNFNWLRAGAVATDGQMMGSHDNGLPRLTLFGLSLAGGSPRTASLALYSVPVPEPSSIALIGSGLVAVLFRRLAAARRKDPLGFPCHVRISGARDHGDTQLSPRDRRR